jgi:hypothetical protein
VKGKEPCKESKEFTMCDITKDRWEVTLINGERLGVYADSRFDAKVQAVTASGLAIIDIVQVASAWPRKVA